MADLNKRRICAAHLPICYPGVFLQQKTPWHVYQSHRHTVFVTTRRRHWGDDQKLGDALRAVPLETAWEAKLLRRLHVSCEDHPPASTRNSPKAGCDHQYINSSLRGEVALKVRTFSRMYLRTIVTRHVTPETVCVCVTTNLVLCDATQAPHPSSTSPEVLRSFPNLAATGFRRVCWKHRAGHVSHRCNFGGA